MKPILVAFIFSAMAALPVRAQVIISSFTVMPSLGGFPITDEGFSSGSWDNVGVFSLSDGILTIGAPADNQGSFPYADLTPFNASGLTLMSALVRSDAGDASLGFVVYLYDSSNNPAANATFNTSALVDGVPTPLTAIVSPFGGGNIAAITYYGLFGDGTSNAFRMSFDQISIAAVPEPATYVAILGGLALGFAAYRRRWIS